MRNDASPRPAFRGPRPGLLSHWVPAIVWVGVMFVMTSLPNPAEVLGPGLQVGDPNAHAIGFFVLAILWARLAIFRAGRFSLRPVAWAAVGCMTYAVIDELHQLPLPERSFEWADLLSDGLGVLAGGAVVTVVGKLRATRRAL